MSFLKHVPLPLKLVLIATLFTVPILWLSTLRVQETRAILDQTAREADGLVYLRPLDRLIDLFQEHELLAVEVARGRAEYEAERAAVEARVDEAIGRLNVVDRALGADLQFNEADLARRRRAGATAGELDRSWEALKRRRAAAKPETIEEEHRRLLQIVLVMIANVYDAGRLVVDPDADATYMALLITINLPNLQDQVGNLLKAGTLALDDKTISLNARIEVASTLNRLDAQRLSVAQRVQAVLSEDPNFRGESPSLQARMPEALRVFESTFRSFADLTRGAFAQGGVPTTAAVFRDSGQKLRESVRGLWTTVDEELNKLFEIRRASIRRDSAFHLSWIGASVLLALLIAGVVSRSISRPLSQCVASLEALAKGDLSKRAATGGRDEVGRMTASLSSAVEGIADAMRSIKGDAARLTHASSELADTSQQMSAGAEQTSTQAGVVSAAAEQVSKSVQTVSIATREMNASIREVAKQATDAAGVATTGVRVANATNSTVAKLGASSAEIGQVIKVITSIAEQTNLLALNATIEAARVGDAGKGFAVVANEVKELARETARASEDVSRKIEAIQLDSRNVVAAITEIGQIIVQINDIQATIASAVEEQTLTTREIGRNLAEAASGATEIARNIHGVADAARNTSDGAHMTQTAAYDLRRLASDLSGLVGRFQVE